MKLMIDYIFKKIYIILNIFFFIVLILPIIFLILLPYCRVRLFLKKRLKIQPSIVWGPVPIINIYYNSKAVNLYGYKSKTVVYFNYRIVNLDLFDYNLSKYFNKFFRKLLFIDIWTFLWTLFLFDIYQFYYDRGFLIPELQILELPLLRLLGKKIVICAYGADVRTEYKTRQLGKYNFFLDFSHEEILKTYGSDQNIEKRVSFVINHADAAISAYDMIEYTKGTINNVFYWAIDLDDWLPIYETNNKKVIIIHSPNHPKYKGTRFVLEAIKRLKDEGYNIEFLLVQNVSNEHAKKIYEKADIVIDQLIGGSHGFFAIEAMALGKPVICYLSNKDYLPDWAECPILNTNPDNLYENLVLLINNKDLRKQLGIRGRKYVEEVYSLEKVGERFNRIYKEIW